jgi:hypothetical protein
MRVSEPRLELEYQRTQLALGRPVDCEAVLGMAEEALREQGEQEKRAEDLEELLGDVLRAFDRFEAANGKPKEVGLEALCELVDELRFAARATGHIALTVEAEGAP